MKTITRETGFVLPMLFLQSGCLPFILQHRNQYKIEHLEGCTIKNFFSPLSNSTF